MALQHTLPLLSDADLAILFHNDDDALRRYRLLHAVLVCGLTQREAAAAGNVSERTVRNVLSAFARTRSLDGLRTRRPGVQRGALRRSAAATDALSAALAEEPLAGGDRLWQRACELLAGAGVSLSRRTAYRMLSQLRSARRQAEPDGLENAVRAALPLLPEDPPLTLGSGSLAQRLLPEVADVRQRGTLLRQALRTAIERLRPPSALDSGDRAWWPYLICTAEYEEGRQRPDVQRELALSASTYSRAKRHALDRIVALVPQIALELTASTASLTCQRLPRTPDFVGRHEEQAYYAWRLQAEGEAHLWGLPGSGKTALAAELAAEGHRAGLRVVWHTCQHGRDATALGVARALVQALAAPDELAEPIERITGENLPELLELLHAHIAERETLVVIDDVHRLDDDSAPLLALLRGHVARGGTRLLLVGRQVPTAGDWPALAGMSEREARLLWASAPAPPAEQWDALYQSVGGLPLPIIRVALAARLASDRGRLEWAAEVSEWAQDAVWSQCDVDERRLLAAAYALETGAVHSSLVMTCRMLNIAPAVLERLQRVGLLRASAEGVAVLGALHSGAAEAARDDTELRVVLERLAEASHAAATLDKRPDSRILNRTPGLRHGGASVLARVRAALDGSAVPARDRQRETSSQRRALARLHERLAN